MFRDVDILKAGPPCSKVKEYVLGDERDLRLIFFHQKFTDYIAVVDRFDLIAPDRAAGWEDIHLATLEGHSIERERSDAKVFDKVGFNILQAEYGNQARQVFRYDPRARMLDTVGALINDHDILLHELFNILAVYESPHRLQIFQRNFERLADIEDQVALPFRDLSFGKNKLNDLQHQDCFLLHRQRLIYFF